MTAYYNENDPFAARWLVNLINAGLIAKGDVDERSIIEVSADEIKKYKQCHFFAGIGVWSYALRLAGWDDARPVWTGSCPCQPFSNAGPKKGFQDDRHLFPKWFELIQERKPVVVFGEQVESKNGLAWFDLVQSSMESLDYACGAVSSPAAGIGAPHIRQRLYWVAISDKSGSKLDRLAYDRKPGLERYAGHGQDGNEPGRIDSAAGGSITEGGVSGGVGDAIKSARQRNAGSVSGTQETFDGAGRAENGPEHFRPEHAGASLRGMGDAESVGRLGRQDNGNKRRGKRASGQADEASGVADSFDGSSIGSKSRTVVGKYAQGFGEVQTEPERAGPTNGFWRDADWLFCTDLHWRPVEPESFPLVVGAAQRVGRLRAYGNAIVAPQATEFIKAAMDLCPE